MSTRFVANLPGALLEYEPINNIAITMERAWLGSEGRWEDPKADGVTFSGVTEAATVKVGASEERSVGGNLWSL